MFRHQSPYLDQNLKLCWLSWAEASPITSSAQVRDLYKIHILGRQIDNSGTLSSGTVISWGKWGFGQRWRYLSASVRLRWACSFSSPTCLRILCCAIMAKKASGRLVSMKHSQLSFNRSLHHCVRWKLNTLLLLV